MKVITNAQITKGYEKWKKMFEDNESLKAAIWLKGLGLWPHSK